MSIHLNNSLIYFKRHIHINLPRHQVLPWSWIGSTSSDTCLPRREPGCPLGGLITDLAAGPGPRWSSLSLSTHHYSQLCGNNDPGCGRPVLPERDTEPWLVVAPNVDAATGGFYVMDGITKALIVKILGWPLQRRYISYFFNSFFLQLINIFFVTMITFLFWFYLHS